MFLGNKAMTNIDSILKSRDITSLTKICIVKGMIFPVVIYRCERPIYREMAEWMMTYHTKGYYSAIKESELEVSQLT